MALQNIGASNSDDAFYRYKMPRMVTKIEGRGNGIKTNIVNMVEIAKALARPASYTTKYFGNELGAQSKFDEKTGTSLVNGAHETVKLAGLLENFIKKYVQCYGCGNPETEIVVSKAQMISLKCAACGFISDVDMRDKLTTFIVKNPPEPKKGGKDKKAMRRAEKERLKEGEAADEEQKKVKKDTVKKKGSSAAPKEASKVSSNKKKGSGSDEDHSPPGSHVDENDSPIGEEEDDGIQWQTDTSFAASRQRIQEQLSAVTADMVMLSVAEDKPKGHKKGISHAVKSSENGSRVVDNHTQLVGEIKQQLSSGSVVQLKSFLSSCSGSLQEKMNALFSALFVGVGKGLAKEVAKEKDLIAACVFEDGSQLCLLHAIEFFCEHSGPDAVKEVALVLKALYDTDVLEEETIMDWHRKGSAGESKSSPIWKNSKPFIDWLEKAESESEDE